MSATRKDNKGRKLRQGEGQKPNGRYFYRYQIDGVRKYIYDMDLNSLRVKEKEIQKIIDAGIDVNKAETMTMNQCFRKWIDGKVNIRDTTKTGYQYLYDKYAKDVIGDMKIANVKYSTLKALYDVLLNTKLSYGTLKILHNALHSAFELAVADDVLLKNPANNLLKEMRNSHNTKTEKRVAMNQQEQDAFLKYARESVVYSNYVPLFIILLGTGMRAGECFALTWRDIDFDNECIYVNKTLTYKMRESGKAEFHIAKTKTQAGTRTIPMLKAVKSAFLEEKKKQFINGKCETVVDGYSDFVFSNSRNHVHKPNTINRVIDNIIKGHNEKEEKLAVKEKREPFLIRHFSVHNFRHTFATNYCQHETNLKTIQEIMGHSNISITMNVYAEATEEKKTESFKNLEDKIKLG